MASLGSLKSAVFEREERKMQYQSHIRGLNAYDRHKRFMKDYVQFYGDAKDSDKSFPVKTDHDTIKEGYRFIVSEEDDMESTWEKRLVKRYYDKLFKEYCIADMSQYKKGKIGLRWRTEKEVISGKGQFICGNRHCDEKDGLGSYEVNFSYIEAEENKQALVKLVACKRCAEKLVYNRNKEKEKLLKRDQEEITRKRKKVKDDEGASTGEKYDMSPDEKKKARKITSSSRDARADEEDLEDFLEGMFP
ncbi:protein FRA10AC1 isoform X2 [Dendrobium catenatum]|uniref:protein FRA10AC1 isoform X2 n=1 Tax=Dendrobium catenatum TaxID=906689 RepID=UPI00109F504A|nr:protein FRA10AC1 isoform X2 [Dendrobium catenatum]